MTSIIEKQRQLHEEIEQYEVDIVQLLLKKLSKHKEKLLRDYQINKLLDQITHNSITLLNIYGDQSNERTNEIHQISSTTDFTEFYNRLKVIKDQQRRNTPLNLTLLNQQQTLQQIQKDKADLKDFFEEELNLLFTAEESFGKYLDLNFLFNTYFLNFLNEKRGDDEKFKENFSYLKYIQKCDDFSLIDKARKKSPEYNKYLDAFVNYLEKFFEKSMPLFDYANQKEKFTEEFNTNWLAGTVEGQKQFTNELVFANHKTGKKHLKAVKRMDLNEKVNNQNNFNLKDIVFKEHLIQKYLDFLKDVRRDTYNRVEGKSMLTAEEWLHYGEEPEEETLAVGEESEGDDDVDDEKIYNPLKLPLGWDGKPIPYWLYKLHGLGVEYPCEICGGYVYMGRKVFDRHFSEWRHNNGLRALGVGSGKQYVGITAIEDAYKLFEKLKSAEQTEISKPEIIEEFEDAEGNVFNKRTYDDRDCYNVLKFYSIFVISGQTPIMTKVEDKSTSEKDKTKSQLKPKSKDELEKDKKEEEAELSEEDQALKNELEMLVDRIKESNQTLYKPSLETLKTLIRTATSSMTSVPKPLKFLRPHYDLICEIYKKWANGPNKLLLADILSVLSMTYAAADKRDCLRYRLEGSSESVGSWGHEYVRHLSLEIMHEFNYRQDKGENTEVLLKLALELVPFFMKHNAEADACDLLLELESLDLLPKFVDKNTFSRVCLYITSCVNYVPPPDDIAILKTAHQIYREQNQFTDSLGISIKLRDMNMIKDDFDSCTDPIKKKQLAFLIARAQINFEIEDEELNEIINNSKLSEHFLSLGRDLDVMEAKTPEDIYKSHLENIRSGISGAKVDSARQNLASTFVNAFVNAGFGSDKLMTGVEDGNSWIYKNKDQGMMSASASLGVILLWGVDVGLPQIDKYLYSTEDYVVAGALLAIGLVTSGVRNESEPALALLSDYVENKKATLRVAAIVGLGIAYAGSEKEEVYELLSPLISDTGVSMEIASLAALSLGLIFIGTCHGELTSSILQTMMERSEAELKDNFAKFMGLGLALLYLGKQEASEATLETLKVIEHPLAKQVTVLVECCSYAGTGNVLKVQNMLHYCNDHLDNEKEDDTFQAFAVLGIALISMGEDIGSEMALRSLNHLMHYGELVTRRVVPLAFGLLCVSNPVVNVIDVLSKYSHDHDQGVAQSAIFAMGLIGAGTNNARLAQMLRQLAAYYHKEPSCLFVVRIAQGMIHMGKGTLTLNPFYANRSLMNPVAVSGLLTALVAFTDSKNTLLGSNHYFLYYLVPAMFPRFLITLDENLNSLSTTVRVGQAVDTVGQAGKPKTITGFQTHSTPVLMAYTERAELGTEEYIAQSNILEGFVILKKNPEWMDEEKEAK
ncbi:proteasome regulatory particle base subunit [Clydaea vesicula]|uniref:Proteasome regulatory particle base subunit n=1 Tax=Clydaea vesicula TaxID=447962 RepID=A0AAD5U5P7_9FUNG|nr:proteasome regulatory particle base subunit [Clydaea vesicula]